MRRESMSGKEKIEKEDWKEGGGMEGRGKEGRNVVRHVGMV
jgi:hypothetical protein